MSASEQNQSSSVVVPSSSDASAAASGDAVLAGANRVATALADRSGQRDRDGWLAVVGDCQSLINTLTAVQDAALAEAARRESDWCEDGTLGEVVHAHGRVTLDAADLAAPVLGATHAQAQRRVELAVRLAADLAPVPAERRELPETSGLSGLHDAMAQGRLDGFRAGVVAFELEGAPAAVADAVITALGTHLHTDAPSLRKRTRVLLSRICPDLVRERAKRARASTGLRRWVAEPGVDEWHGTFPSEDAAAAWAAIDRLAHDLVADGTCSSVEQARGKALTDLVTGHAKVDIQVVLTVPADTTPPEETPAVRPAMPTDAEAHDSRHSSDDDGTVTSAPATEGAPTATRSDDDLVEVQGARPSEPLLVRHGWLRDQLATSSPRPGRRAKPPPTPLVPCDPLTGARLDPHDDLATDVYRPGTELAALVRARDGRCRFPGCAVAARFCDLDHVRPWPIGDTAASNLLTLCRRHHRVKQRPGWRLQLSRDGTATWADPRGGVRSTQPLDALSALVLLSDEADIPRRPASQAPAPAGPAPAWSALETRWELRLEHAPSHRRCSSASALRAAHAERRARELVPDIPPF